MIQWNRVGPPQWATRELTSRNALNRRFVVAVPAVTIGRSSDRAGRTRGGE